MSILSLKRLLSRKDTLAIVHQMTAAIAQPLFVQDLDGNILLGDNRQPAVQQFPILVEDQVIGWVSGTAAAETIAQLLSYLATKELEKKRLAQETLDRYKEITLLYSTCEKITANLELAAIARLVLEEARKLIAGDTGFVLLLNADTQHYESVVAFGDRLNDELTQQAQQGIIASILTTGTGEIVNWVSSDPRWIPPTFPLSSLICAPIKSRGRVLGAITITSETPVDYAAGDLKLLNAIASQAAAAIENAVLHANKLREERIKSNLERYVSSQLVQAILEAKGDISLAPVRKQITILFSDIRSFTQKCEELEPELIVGYLNEYFTHMVDVIFDHNGTVNKFVGDMIVALFGAPSPFPDTEKQAIEAAIAMQRRIQTIPVDWIRDNFPTGIGISSGKVIVGNIGSPRHTDYTAIGDEVNTASRLQSIAKGGQILVSRGVYDATCSLFQFNEVGSLTVKGKRNAVEVFEVVY